MEEQKAHKEVLRNNVGDQVISRVNELSQAGFTFPKDYNVVNAIKMSVLKLQELKDKNGKPALEVCTPVSIQSALFKMATKGLSLAYNQAYAIVRGTTLCIDEGYFGKILMVKRIFPEWEPMPRSIREGDEYITEVDAKTGKKKLVKHIQKLENLDKEFIGGYIYLPSGDGEMYLYEMTRKQILAAWSKSSSTQQLTHKQFDEKMLQKTLVNSGCNIIINSTPELNAFEDEANQEQDTLDASHQIEPNYSEFEEVTEVEEGKPEETHDEVPKTQKNTGKEKQVKPSVKVNPEKDVDDEPF